MKFVKVFLILLFLHAVFVSGDEIGEISFSITPGGVILLGESTSYFKTGAGVRLSVDLRLNSLPLFFLKLDSSYAYIPILTLDGVSVYSASAGVGINFNPLERLYLAVYGTGGYFYSFVTDGSGSGGGTSR